MRRRQRTRYTPPVAAALCVAVACGGGTEGSPTTSIGLAPSTTQAVGTLTETDAAVVITVPGLSFPPEVTVPGGNTVTWVNDSSAPHEVQMDTFDGADVDMEAVQLGTDQEGSLLLEAGTWTYFCAIHPSMTGRLVIEG